jgi:hypothetical protein
MTRKEEYADRRARLDPLIPTLAEKVSEHEPELLDSLKERVRDIFRSAERYDVEYINTGSERRPNIEISINPTGCKHRLEDYETVKDFVDECNGNMRASYESGFGFYPEDYNNGLGAELQDRVYTYLRSHFPSGLSAEDQDYLNDNDHLTDLAVDIIYSLLDEIRAMNLADLFVP